MDFDAWLQQKGHTGFLPDAVARKLYDEFMKEGRQWELKQDAQGNMVRANPQTGLVLAMTNEQGQPVKGANANPFADYAGPGAGGVAGATVDPSSAAFQGVQPTAAPQANPVAPVNVNPAMPSAAPAPAPTPAPTPVANRVRVTAAEFEQTYGRKVQPGTAFPYKDEQGNTIAIIEVE